MPADITFLHLIAVALLAASWSGYSTFLSILGKGSLNAQLTVVRQRWMDTSMSRELRMPDAMLLGHMINSVAFFGSATLIVLAGLIGAAANINRMHGLASDLPFIGPMSVELFSFNLAVVGVVLIVTFFLYTYALRKLIYTAAMLGGLPINPPVGPRRDGLVEATATVLTEAVKSFNSGIRGYYFAVAALFLFAGPGPCIGATVFVIIILLWRQMATRTATAIGRYVEFLESNEDD
ncbi:MAG: DUF599 domain-containing protein [Pseudomonadota bacterium]